MDESTAGRPARSRTCALRLVLPVLLPVLAVLVGGPPAAAAAPPPAPGLSAEAAVADGGFVDVLASSTSAALQVDGQEGRFATTPMAHDEGSTRFSARLPVTGPEPVTSVTVRTLDTPPSTVTVDVRAIVVTRATYDGTALTVAATAGGAAGYPLTVEADGPLGTLPSAAPVSFPTAAPPRTVTVSSGTSRTTAPVLAGTGPAPAAAPAPAPPAGPVAAPPAPAALPAALPATRTLTAPRGLPTVIDGSASRNATAFSTVIKSGPQGSSLVDADTPTPSIVLPTWAAPTDVLPRVAPATAPTVVTFTATRDGASSSVDVTVTPVGDTVTVTTARAPAGAELEVAGTSALPGTGPTPTQVVVYARATAVADPTGTEPGWVKVGSAAVDDAGAFSVRARPEHGLTFVQYLVQTSRGTQVTGTLAP